MQIVFYICHTQVHILYNVRILAIPYGAALRIKRNCSANSDLSKRCEEYKRYLVRQEYPKSLVDKEFNKALKVNRKNLLHAKVKPKKKVYPFVTEFNPTAPITSHKL